jgi:hypothetical protein
MSPRSGRSRQQSVSIVESFFRCIVDKDIAGLPVDPALAVQSPLTPRVSGRAAMDYVRAVAANTHAIRVVQHIVEGDEVASLTENETSNGPLSLFAKFHLDGDHIAEVRVFYDTRQLAGGSSAAG